MWGPCGAPRKVQSSPRPEAPRRAHPPTPPPLERPMDPLPRLPPVQSFGQSSPQSAPPGPLCGKTTRKGGSEGPTEAGGRSPVFPGTSNPLPPPAPLPGGGPLHSVSWKQIWAALPSAGCREARQTGRGEPPEPNTPPAPWREPHQLFGQRDSLAVGLSPTETPRTPV